MKKVYTHLCNKLLSGFSMILVLFVMIQLKMHERMDLSDSPKTWGPLRISSGMREYERRRTTRRRFKFQCVLVNFLLVYLLSSF